MRRPALQVRAQAEARCCRRIRAQTMSLQVGQAGNRCFGIEVLRRPGHGVQQTQAVGLHQRFDVAARGIPQQARIVVARYHEGNRIHAEQRIALGQRRQHHLARLGLAFLDAVKDGGRFEQRAVRIDLKLEPAIGGAADGTCEGLQVLRMEIEGRIRRGHSNRFRTGLRGGNQRQRAGCENTKKAASRHGTAARHLAAHESPRRRARCEVYDRVPCLAGSDRAWRRPPAENRQRDAHRTRRIKHD
ncbi:hypothetical protein R82526_00490 [Ralstonia mannitolilytica]|nr:hypothetical protein R82526_00490 [Ralstonia mannitolilytica]